VTVGTELPKCGPGTHQDRKRDDWRGPQRAGHRIPGRIWRRVPNTSTHLRYREIYLASNPFLWQTFCEGTIVRPGRSRLACVNCEDNGKCGVSSSPTRGGKFWPSGRCAPREATHDGGCVPVRRRRDGPLSFYALAITSEYYNPVSISTMRQRPNRPSRHRLTG